MTFLLQEVHVNGVSQGHTVGIRVPEYDGVSEIFRFILVVAVLKRVYFSPSPMSAPTTSFAMAELILTANRSHKKSSTSQPAPMSLRSGITLYEELNLTTLLIQSIPHTRAPLWFICTSSVKPMLLEADTYCHCTVPKSPTHCKRVSQA